MCELQEIVKCFLAFDPSVAPHIKDSFLYKNDCLSIVIFIRNILVSRLSNQIWKLNDCNVAINAYRAGRIIYKHFLSLCKCFGLLMIFLWLNCGHFQNMRRRVDWFL